MGNRKRKFCTLDDWSSQPKDLLQLLSKGTYCNRMQPTEESAATAERTRTKARTRTRARTWLRERGLRPEPQPTQQLRGAQRRVRTRTWTRERVRAAWSKPPPERGSTTAARRTRPRARTRRRSGEFSGQRNGKKRYNVPRYMLCL